ncbi:MAG: lipid biosynthesis B12-binding/radical SAM protein [Bacteroidota bacterium]
MKKLLLVSANQMKVPYPVYPLGISYLTTFLRNRLTDFEIRVFDFMDKDYEAYIKLLNEFRPDYTGVSLRNIDDVNIYIQESFINHYKTIIEKTRENTSGKIIIGGAGFSIFPELLFKTLNPDFGIYGEGEERMLELITALENNSDYSQIKSLVFKKDDKIIFNKKQQSLQKLDLHFESGLLDYYWLHSGMLNIQTKRGCPYNCIYCTYPVIEGRNVRTLDIDSIVDTLHDLSVNKKIDYIFFTDSIFNVDNNFNHELCEKLIRKNINIKWGAYFNFCNLDEKILELFKIAGLRHIEFGTESLSDAMLKNYRKPFTVNDIIDISKICVKLEIDFAHFLILGGYGEIEDTLDETFENSKKIERTVFFPFIGMRIYPGTELYDIALRENKISKTDDLLVPKYYISDKINIDTLKEKAAKTGRPWVFPDYDFSVIMNKMRMKNKKGPLWEYQIR